jgi:hypothetical protein
MDLIQFLKHVAPRAGNLPRFYATFQGVARPEAGATLSGLFQTLKQTVSIMQYRRKWRVQK